MGGVLGSKPQVRLAPLTNRRENIDFPGVETTRSTLIEISNHTNKIILLNSTLSLTLPELGNPLVEKTVVGLRGFF